MLWRPWQLCLLKWHWGPASLLCGRPKASVYWPVYWLFCNPKLRHLSRDFCSVSRHVLRAGPFPDWRELLLSVTWGKWAWYPSTLSVWEWVERWSSHWHTILGESHIPYSQSLKQTTARRYRHGSWRACVQVTWTPRESRSEEGSQDLTKDSIFFP